MTASSIKQFVRRVAGATREGQSGVDKSIAAAARTAVPSIEGLESRQMMTVVPFLADGILKVTGDNTGNTINIDHVGTKTFVNLQGFDDADITNGIQIRSGAGADHVNIKATVKPVTVEGQNGRDTVTLGNLSSAQSIGADVTISNTSSFTQVNVNNGADPEIRNVTMGVDANAFGFISGLAPGTIRFKSADTAGVIVSGGLSGHNFNVTNTVNSNVAPVTSIIGSLGSDKFNVRKTSGKLDINGGAGGDTVNVGSEANSLDGILGAVTASGGFGLAQDTININDQGSTTPSVYIETVKSLTRSGTAPINFSNFEIRHVNKGALANPSAGSNSAPMVSNLKLPKAAHVGEFVKLTGQLLDVDAGDKLTLTVDWGDGSKVQKKAVGFKKFAIRHRFVAAGEFTVRATWTDSTGLSNTRELLITVAAKVGKGGR